MQGGADFGEPVSGTGLWTLVAVRRFGRSVTSMEAGSMIMVTLATAAIPATFHTARVAARSTAAALRPRAAGKP
jgi:hypothetical protein